MEVVAVRREEEEERGPAGKGAAALVQAHGAMNRSVTRGPIFPLTFGYRGYVESDAELARKDLELARATSSRLWAEYRAFVETLDPSLGVAGPEELRQLREASEWTGRKYAAEHALFAAENGTPGIVGAHGEYQWLTVLKCDISSLLRLCPGVVLNKYLAVTSIDSGTLQLTDQEKDAGWWTSEEAKVFRDSSWGHREDDSDWKVAYSPRLDSIHGLPDETHGECCAGFDEWYVFERAVPPGEIEAFVNWSGFRLYDHEWKWCTDRFWEQMARLAPESYIADGTVFTFATRNAGLFTEVLSAFSASAK